MQDLNAYTQLPVSVPSPGGRAVPVAEYPRATIKLPPVQPLTPRGPQPARNFIVGMAESAKHRVTKRGILVRFKTVPVFRSVCKYVWRDILKKEKAARAAA